MNKINENYEMNLFEVDYDDDNPAFFYSKCTYSNCDFYKPNCICRYTIKGYDYYYEKEVDCCTYIENDWSQLPW